MTVNTENIASAPSGSLTVGASKVGLIAGNGQFPLDFAKKVKEQGAELTIIAFEGESDPELKDYATSGYHQIKVGQFGKLLKIVKKSGISQLAFAGGISRVRLFKNFIPDMKALTLAAKAGSIKDDVILRAVASEISKLGVEVINAAYLLDKAIPQPGCLTRRDLTSGEKQDALQGWEAAKTIGSLEIGQSVVVYKSLVLAVEAVEGTDQMIARAGQLSDFCIKDNSAYRDLSVLVKVCKPQQDRRLDLPTFGPQTIESMRSAGISALVVEAGACLLIDPVTTIDLADKHGMAVFAARSELDLVVDKDLQRDFRFRG